MAAETSDAVHELESQLLEAALRHASRLGWNGRLMAAAAAEAGVDPSLAGLILPAGARDLAALLAARHDRKALERLAAIDPAGLKVRERIRAAVLARCDAARADGEAVRRWMGFLLLPANAGLGLRLAWASADALWRWAGDVAVDENHYSKRALLAEILVSAQAIDIHSGRGAAERHLDRRIGQVMAFERLKGRLRGSRAERLAGMLGGWRYGRGPASPEATSARSPASSSSP
ncbi:MAG TPA: COQ9 family protein [Caulobacteraceae bacterium]|nr:COQ9 family protein [Caulobacteraceae bacterium]